MSNKKHYEAIKDVHVNLENRNHAIDEYGYGPLNPKEKNDDFWNAKAKLWKTSVEEAKKSRCGNCAAFNRTPKIIKAMGDALGPVGNKIVEKANLGFCEFFYFKCAGDRTCDAWIVNGPLQEAIGPDDASVSSVTSAMKRGTGVPSSTENETPEGFQSNKLPSASEIKKYRDIKLDKMRNEPVKPELAKNDDFDTPERKDFLKNYLGKDKPSPITAPRLPFEMPRDQYDAKLYNQYQDRMEKDRDKVAQSIRVDTMSSNNLSPAQRGIRTIRGALDKTMPNSTRPLEYKSLNEDGAPANATGAAIPGTGDDPQAFPRGEPLKKYKKKTKKEQEAISDNIALMRRATPMSEDTGTFAGSTTFIVPSDIFHEAKMQKKKGKHWRTYIGEEDHWQHIREYARKNPKKAIILQDERTGAMCYARYGSKQ